VLVVEKKSKRFRIFKRKRLITAFSRQYPQDDLVKALDAKLSVLQNTQALEQNFTPRYILTSESDACPDALRSPDMLPTLPDWCSPAKHRVLSDSRSIIR